MNVTRRELLKGAAALGMAGALPGAMATSAHAQTTQKRELVVAQGGDIAKFDPHFSTASNEIRWSFNVFDNLTSRHPDGKLYPGLATEWKLQGQTACAFKLRQGVKYHNGDPFTSADAKYSIERTYDPAAKTMVATALSTIDRIEAPDPYSLVIHTKKPDPLLPARLAFYGGQIVPKKYLESVGADTFNTKPVGTGPVRLSSWVKDDKAVFDAYPDYWGGKIDMDRLIVRAIPETAPRIAALLKGEVDIITQLPPDQAERITGTATTRVVGALYAGLYVLGVNSKRPPLDNPYDASLPPLAYNPKEAREPLKKAGYKGEEVFIETTVAYVSQDKPMAEAIAAMWKDVGVNAKVEVIEFSVRAQKNREKSFKGVFWSDPTSTLGDPDGMMWRLLGPGGPQDYWREARFDEMGNAARFSVDEKFRGESYAQMTRIFLEHFPWLPVIQPYEDYGLQKYVEWTANPNQQFEIRRFNLKLRRA